MKQIAEIEQNGATTPMWRSLGLIFVRYGIGGTMILAGVILLIAVPGDLGAYGCASAVGAGMSVLLLNLLFRMSVSGDRDRELEEQARRYFDEHGEWPDDETPERGRRQWTLAPGVLTAEQAEETHDFSGPSVPLVRPAKPQTDGHPTVASEEHAVTTGRKGSGGQLRAGTPPAQYGSAAPMTEERQQISPKPRSGRTRSGLLPPMWRRRFFSGRRAIAVLTLCAFVIPGVLGVVLAVLSL